MGTKRYNPITGNIGMATTGAIGPDGSVVAGNIDYVALVDGTGTEIKQSSDANATTVRSALGAASIAYAGITGGIIGTADTAIMAAAGAGVRNFLHSLQFKNTSAVASEIVVKDGATVIWRGHVSANMAVMDGWTFDPPLRGTANTAINVALLITATATIVCAQGSTGS